MAPEGPLSTAEIWDPATSTFTPVDTTFAPPEMHTATFLADGCVLFIDDTDRYGEPIPAQVWDRETGVMTPTGSLAEVRAGHTATLLADGRVLVVGGWNSTTEEGDLASAETWDPATGTFGPAGSLAETIRFPTVTALPDGRAPRRRHGRT